MSSMEMTSKKTYQKPSLRVIGSTAEITQGLPGGGADFDGGPVFAS